jgi:hypothetical protein
LLGVIWHRAASKKRRRAIPLTELEHKEIHSRYPSSLGWISYVQNVPINFEGSRQRELELEKRRHRLTHHLEHHDQLTAVYPYGSRLTSAFSEAGRNITYSVNASKSPSQLRINWGPEGFYLGGTNGGLLFATAHDREETTCSHIVWETTMQTEDERMIIRSR